MATLAPRLLALLALALLALPSAPVQAACTPLVVQSYTRGIVDPAAEAPEVCVEALSANVYRIVISWRSPATEMEADLFRVTGTGSTARTLLLRGTYTTPLDAPEVITWSRPSVAPTLLQVVEWQNARLVGVTRYTWAEPAAEQLAPYQLALPLLAR